MIELIILRTTSTSGLLPTQKLLFKSHYALHILYLLERI